MATRPPTVVFGAGGPTGSECVKRLVDLDQPVRCVVRDPAKYEGKFPVSSLVEVAQGDVTDAPSVHAALTGARAAIFTASASNFRGAEAVDHKGAANVANASKEHKLGRMVLVSSCLVTPRHRLHPIRIMLNNIKWSLMDKKFAGEEAVRRSGVDYTIVRAGGLTDAPAGQAKLAVGQGDKIMGQVSRGDVAFACVAAALGEPGTRNVTFELVGAKPQEPPPDGMWESLWSQLKPDAELKEA